MKLEEERRALAAFVTKFDSLGLKMPSSKLQLPKPTPGGALTAYAERRQSKLTSLPLNTAFHKGNTEDSDTSPIRPNTTTQFKSQPRLLDQVMPEEADNMSFDEFEVEQQLLNTSVVVGKMMGVGGGGGKNVMVRDVFGDKENILPEQV